MLGARDSIDSLLLSPWELLMRRDRLAILDRLRITAAENDADRLPSRNTPLTPLSRVVVELLLVNDGTSSTDILNSGPGSPNNSDWKAFSSAIEEGAVEIRWVSYEYGERGDGNDDCVVDRGLVGVGYGACKVRDLTSTGAKSFAALGRKGGVAVESDD